ncbi:MAG: hypothetical protein RL522_2015 [Pseudomonadota bacterium]|jgi:peptide/nickel transport system substrate-binding protein
MNFLQSFGARRPFTWAALTLTAAGAFMFGNAQAVEAPKRGGTLVVGLNQTPRHLNGAVQSGIATAMPSTQLFASPLRYDDQWNPQPYLAEKWSVAPDGKSVTLNLRRDALFHDGKPVTSADVAYSIMVIKQNHPFQTMFEPVEKVDTPDPYTAVIRLSRPHPAILLAMSPALCPILPKHIYDDGKDIKSHPRNSANLVGSGPFRLVEFKAGQTIVMERFDKFFLQGKPYLDKIVIDQNPDMASQLLAVERGTVHMLPHVVSPADLKRVSNNPKLELTSKGYDGIGGLNWLAFNTSKKPFDDVRVRKAIAHSIDKKFVQKALMGGFGQISDGPIVGSSPFAVDDVVKYPFDLKKAAALMDEAGFKPNASGERLKFTVDYLPGASEQKAQAEYLKAQLKKVGVTVEVRTSADFPAWAKRMATHDFDVSFDAVFNWGDPVIGVHRTYLSTNIKPIVWTNTQSYRNPKVDELLNTAGGLLDPTKRRAYYATFQKLVTDDAPIVYINQIPYHTAATKQVGNLPKTIWGPYSPYDEIYLK